MSEIETIDSAHVVDVERRLAPRIAGLALIAGIFPVIGTVIQSPRSSAPQSTIGTLLYYSDHSSLVIAGSLLRGAGLLALVAPIIFLLNAATARGGKTPRVAAGASVVGGIAAATGTVVLGIASVMIANDFVNKTGLTYDQGKAVLKGPLIMAASGAGLIGTVGLAFGLAMAALNAMRVGLLTRFMGYVGILAGVLLVIPIFSPVPIVQLFWLAALAALILGRWPGAGVPPAWADGEAHPWPTAAAMRAASKADQDEAEAEHQAAKENRNGS